MSRVEELTNNLKNMLYHDFSRYFNTSVVDWEINAIYLEACSNGLVIDSNDFLAELDHYVRSNSHDLYYRPEFQQFKNSLAELNFEKKIFIYSILIYKMSK